jgi:hypothetical protein
MGDSAQIVAFKVDGLHARERAADALAWLAGRGVIEALPTDSGLGALAHRPGPNALEAVVAQKKGVMDFRMLRTNGMEVRASSRPELQTSGDEMPVFECPKCKAEIDADDVLPLVEEVASAFKAVPDVACAKCRKKTPIVDLRVEGGAFANLSLRFWNWWPLKPSFVEELAAVCGAPASVVYERI